MVDVEKLVASTFLARAIATASCHALKRGRYSEKRGADFYRDSPKIKIKIKIKVKSKINWGYL
jgi:hypothetical protein